MSTAFIIPGFTENPKDAKYRNIKRFFATKNIDATIVNIQWKNATMSDYVEQFLKQYKKSDGNTIILGFSFGAMIAAIAQQHTQADHLILCSLSPFFKEDLPRIKPSWIRQLGKRRVEDFQTHSFSTIAKQIIVPTDIIAGDKEGSEVIYRAQAAQRLIKNNTLHILPGTKHDIAAKIYQQKVQEIIHELVT